MSTLNPESMYPAIIQFGVQSYDLSELEKKELLSAFMIHTRWHPNHPSPLNFTEVNDFIDSEANPHFHSIRRSFEIDVHRYQISTTSIPASARTSRLDQHKTFNVNVQVEFQPVIVLSKLDQEKHVVSKIEHLESYRQGNMIPIRVVKISTSHLMVGYQKL